MILVIKSSETYVAECRDEDEISEVLSMYVAIKGKDTDELELTSGGTVLSKFNQTTREFDTINLIDENMAFTIDNISKKEYIAICTIINARHRPISIS